MGAYRAVVAERTRTLNQLQALHTTAPLTLRERIGPGSGKQLAARLRKMRDRSDATRSERVILGVLRDLARHHAQLSGQADTYQQDLAELINSLDRELLNEPGVGPISAAKLLVADPVRLKSEAAFARCNGAAPTPASSGQTIRHRLSRGGDRQANNALHTIAHRLSTIPLGLASAHESATCNGNCVSCVIDSLGSTGFRTPLDPAAAHPPVVSWVIGTHCVRSTRWPAWRPSCLTSMVPRIRRVTPR